jgi:ABC-type dipeptide/oligopeptide/nickel transport system permease component
MRGLLPFLAHRLFRALIALWLVSTVVFVVMRLSGDPVPLLLPPDAPTSEIMRVRRDLGLDRPLPVQYGVFLGNILRGDFGRSIHFREPAFTVVRGYLAATLELGLTAFVLATLIALPIGLLSAMKRNSLLDHAAMGVALVGQSAPTFFMGILFILLLSLKADLFPTSGRGDWKHLVLPALTLGAFTMASIARLTRSAVLEVLGADYIRTARAKGVAEVFVVAKHTLKNAAIPIVTITGLQFGTLLGGAVVTETVFSWPGIGRLAVQSIYNRDYPVVQCTVFLAAVMFIVIVLVPMTVLRGAVFAPARLAMKHEEEHAERVKRGDENADPLCNGPGSGTVGEGFVRPAPHVGLAAQSAPFGDRQDEFNSGLVREPVHFRDLIPFGAPTFRRCAERHPTGAIRTEQPELVGVAPKTIPHLCAPLLLEAERLRCPRYEVCAQFRRSTQQLDPVSRNNSCSSKGMRRRTMRSRRSRRPTR